jgi:glutamate/tyrosine decarboxylase-like PLP-dependent enzyme
VGRATAAAATPGAAEADAVYYVPEEAHYCIRKALRVLGVRPEAIVPMPMRLVVDSVAAEGAAEGAARRGVIDLAALGRLLEQSTAPAVLVATAGTTSTGAVDDLAGLAALRDAHAARGAGAWLHVDGCFGAFFMLTRRGREGLLGSEQGSLCLEQADSVALDPHKAMQLSYGVGALMVRRHGVETLKRAFGTGTADECASGAYCPPANGSSACGSVSSIADLSLELSREARGCQVWLPVRAYGTTAFASHLDWCLDAAQWVAEQLSRRASHLELVAPPLLSVVNFRFASRCVCERVTREELTRALVSEVNSMGRVLVAPTHVGSEHSLRICALSSRTEPKHLSALVEDVLMAEATVVSTAERLERARANPDGALGFLVPYAVEHRPSRGLCVVAAADVAEGEPVWRFEPGACPVVREADFRRLRAEMSAEQIADFLNHCFPWEGELLCARELLAQGSHVAIEKTLSRPASQVPAGRHAILQHLERPVHPPRGRRAHLGLHAAHRQGGGDHRRLLHLRQRGHRLVRAGAALLSRAARRAGPD